jgi:hypothetical protein
LWSQLSSNEEVIAWPIASSVFPALSYTSFKVSGLILRLLIHFELLVQGDKHGSNFSFLQADIQFFPESFVEVVIFSALYVFGAFVKH